jgi:predicted double-glycine peptidase
MSAYITINGTQSVSQIFVITNVRSAIALQLYDIISYTYNYSCYRLQPALFEVGIIGD